MEIHVVAETSDKGYRDEKRSIRSVTIDGREAEPFRGIGPYSRALWVDHEAGVLVKCDDCRYPFREGQDEATLWESMNPEDRPFFVPIFQSGEIQGTEELRERRERLSCIPDTEPYTWVAQPFRPDFREIHHTDADYLDIARQVRDLAKRYKLEDLAKDYDPQYVVLSQIKRTQDDSFLIHDYGQNVYSPAGRW